LKIGRQEATATLLANGKVLIAGGYGNSGYLDSAELYDPATGTWAVTGALSVARQNHTATLLPNGQVLVVGGFGNASYLSSAELYDPVSGTWSLTGSLGTRRQWHTATLLPNGKVLVARGWNNVGALSNNEIYDPATGAWSLSGILNPVRYGHTATLLPSGKVLLLGGRNGSSYLVSAELYDLGLGYTNTAQPQITAATTPLSPGGNLVITGAQFSGISGGSSGNTQDSGTGYPLVQLRSIESGQTMFLPGTNWSANTFTSTAVSGFPPGYTLVTMFVNGIQSTSSIVNLSVPSPASTTLGGSVRLTNSGFGFSFTNNPGVLFGVLATTNLSLPQTNWTRLGGVVEAAPGQFQFNDPQATNIGQRYYSLFVP
jgi:hypothetical protein